MTLILFSKHNCEQCDNLTALLDNKNIIYEKKQFSNLYDLVSKESFDEDNEEVIINIGSFPILSNNGIL